MALLYEALMQIQNSLQYRTRMVLLYTKRRTISKTILQYRTLMALLYTKRAHIPKYFTRERPCMALRNYTKRRSIFKVFYKIAIWCYYIRRADPYPKIFYKITTTHECNQCYYIRNQSQFKICYKIAI